MFIYHRVILKKVDFPIKNGAMLVYHRVIPKKKLETSATLTSGSMFLIFGKFGLWILGGSSTSTIEYPRLSTVVVFLHLVANKRWKMMGNVIQKLLISPGINTIEYIYIIIYIIE